MNLSYIATSVGYLLFANNRFIGGYRGLGTPTHTSEGRRRRLSDRRASLEMNTANARYICRELRAGRGPAYLRKRLTQK